MNEQIPSSPNPEARQKPTRKAWRRAVVRAALEEVSNSDIGRILSSAYYSLDIAHEKRGNVPIFGDYTFDQEGFLANTKKSGNVYTLPISGKEVGLGDNFKIGLMGIAKDLQPTHLPPDDRMKGPGYDLFLVTYNTENRTASVQSVLTPTDMIDRSEADLSKQARIMLLIEKTERELFPL